MADKIPPRFRKTKTDKWAVMAPIEDLEKALADGGKIEVQRKSGDWSSFQVASLGRPFDVDGVQMCYGYGPDEEGSDSGGAGAPTKPRRRSGPPAETSSQVPDSKLDEQPRPDESEPLPEYEGGAEDEWSGF